MSRITSHVLDVAHGCPAAGVRVRLGRLQPGGEWADVAEAVTDEDGRVSDLAHGVEPGTCRLTFETGVYFGGLDVPAFHPQVEVTFAVTDANQHYHVPLLLSPFGYTTYRGT